MKQNIKFEQYGITIAKEKYYFGESIEKRVRRILETGEAIDDTAPIIFQERKDGVKPEHDIRADKWEIAQKAMRHVSEERIKKRSSKKKEPNVIGSIEPPTSEETYTAK